MVRGDGMENYIITIDTGTTNTRVILWDADRKMAASRKSEVGVRNTAIDGNNQRLKDAVRDGIEGVLQDEGKTLDDVSRVMACGMITSNVGLVEVPHVTAPASAQDLADQAREILLEDVCAKPIMFIPGVKNSSGPVTLENFEQMDIMRGEEVETVAVLNDYPKGKSYLLVLPGSHSKFVSVNENGQMAGCLTSITGELLSSITRNTIIADAVGRQFVGEDGYDHEMVLAGFKNAQKTGMGRACFSGRILNQFVIPEKEKIANYILGVALQNDIVAVKNSDALEISPETTVIVGGNNPLRRAITELLRFDGYFKEVVEYVPDGKLPLSPVGAYIVADLMQNKEEQGDNR